MLWPGGAHLIGWDRALDSREQSQLSLVVDDYGYEALHRSPGGEASVECIQFSFFDDGSVTTISPVTTSGTPKVFIVSPEGIDLLMTIAGEDQPRSVADHDDFPTLATWIGSLVDAHVSGRIRFVEDPDYSGAMPIPSGPGEDDDVRFDFSYPWPSLSSSQTATATSQPTSAVERVSALRSGPELFDLAWVGDEGRVLQLDGSTVRLLDLVTSGVLTEVEVDPASMAVRLHPDAEMFLVARAGDGGDVWSVRSCSTGESLSESVAEAASWSTSGHVVRFVRSGHNGRYAELLGSDNFRVVLQHSLSHNNQVWAPRGQYFVTHGGTEPAALRLLYTEQFLELPFANSPLAFTFNSDGTRLAVIAGTDSIIVNVNVGSIRRAGKAGTAAVHGEWSPDGQRLAMVTQNGVVDIVDVNGETTGRWNDVSAGSSTNDRRVAWSPEGDRLASNAPHDDVWVVQNTHDGSVVCRFNVLDTVVPEIRWSPTGTHLLTGNTVFDAESGAALHHLTDFDVSHTGEWSPNGQMIALRTGGGLSTWTLP